MPTQFIEMNLSDNRVVASACILMFVISLDVTVVNVALPTIQGVLNVPIGSLGFAVVAYTLPFATLMLSAGALSDRFGAEKAYLSGVVILGIGSLIGAAAPDFTILLLGRVIQGIGAALCMPASLTVLRSTVPSQKMGQAIALWGFSGSAAIAAGPILSGLLVQYTTWRSVFLINIPFIVLAVWFVLPLADFVKQTSPAPKKRIDIIGQALFIVSATLLVGGLTLISEPVDTAQGQIPAIMLGLAILGTATLLLQQRRATHPVMPTTLLKHKVFQSAVMVGGSVSFVNFGIVYCLSIYYGIVHEFGPLVVGALYLPMMLATGAATLVVERIRRALGDRKTVTFGLGSQFIGAVLISLQPGLVGWVSANAAFLGFGVGLVIPPITSRLLNSVDVELTGVASGAFSSIRQFAAAIGIVVLGLQVHGAGALAEVDLRSIAIICATVLAIATGFYLAIFNELSDCSEP